METIIFAYGATVWDGAVSIGLGSVHRQRLRMDTQQSRADNLLRHKNNSMYYNLSNILAHQKDLIRCEGKEET
jgi:hypothetical protein